MKNKLFAVAFCLSFMVSLCVLAQDATQPTTKDANGTTTVKTATPAVQMPKAPEIDPKTWDFIPDVVATVGSKNITKDELIRVLNPQVKMMIMMGQKPDSTQCRDLAVGITHELVKATIVENLAADAGYKVTPEIENQVYNKFVENMKKQMPNSKNFNFEDMIKQQGLTVADVKKQMAEGEVIQNWINEKIMPQVTITDTDVTAFYNKNKDTFFKRPETVTASHILIKPKEDNAKGWADAKALADNVYKQLENGANFAEMAKKYSDGPSKDNGGQLGTFSKGQMVPEFEAACWKLVNNNMKGYEEVKTQFGWHIVKVTAYDKGGYMPLDAALTAQIKEKLKQEAVFKKVNELVDAQMKQVNPQIFLKNDVDASTTATP